MIKFYTNRELSEKLSIGLSKWKRWSREFLPPDPLGGLQSGYARQYTLDQAFAVFLGGHLVANLHFSIPESNQILEDLGPWIRNRRSAHSGKADNRACEDIQVYIFRQFSPQTEEVNFAYLERKRLIDEPFGQGGSNTRHEVYMENFIPVASRPKNVEQLDPSDRVDSRILYATRLFDRFISAMSA